MNLRQSAILVMMGLGAGTALTGLSMSTPALAQAGETFGDAVAAYSLQDFEKARRIWTPMADAGGLDAQYRLAMLYELGKGIPVNDERAAHYYRLAAEQGHSGAQMRIANYYATGDGVEQDAYEAFRWFCEAAKNGEPRAQYHVGRAYLAGSVVDADPVEAFVWVSRAAETQSDGEIRRTAIAARDAIRPALKPEQLARAREMLAEDAG